MKSLQQTLEDLDKEAEKRYHSLQNQIYALQVVTIILAVVAVLSWR